MIKATSLDLRIETVQEQWETIFLRMGVMIRDKRQC